MKKNRLVSFWALPASWGLKGDAYAIAEAHYNYDGEDLDRELAMIVHRNDATGLARQTLEIDYRYGRIETYTYECRKVHFEYDNVLSLQLRLLDIEVHHDKLTPYDGAKQKAMLQTKEGVERDVALLTIDYEFNRLSKSEFEKQRATLRDEPWIAIIDSGFDPEQGIDGVFFEFDWNTQWIDFLKLNGYVGHLDEQIVDDWFTDVCRSHSSAEPAGSITTINQM